MDINHQYYPDNYFGKLQNYNLSNNLYTLINLRLYKIITTVIVTTTKTFHRKISTPLKYLSIYVNTIEI